MEDCSELLHREGSLRKQVVVFGQGLSPFSREADELTSFHKPASDFPVQQESCPAAKYSYRVYSFAHAAEDLCDVVLLRVSEFLDWNCSWAQAKQPCLQQVMTKAVGVCIEPTSLRSNVTWQC